MTRASPPLQLQDNNDFMVVEENVPLRCYICGKASNGGQAKEQPEREELSEWSRNGGIRAQRALAAAQVTTFVTEKEAGRGKSI